MVSRLHALGRFSRINEWGARGIRAAMILSTAGMASGIEALPGQVTPQSLQALDGEWVFLEDRTEGRALEQMGPPMSSKFSIRTEAGAVVLDRGHGSGHREVRLALDGSPTDVPGTAAGTYVRYRGGWKDGALWYETEYVRSPGGGLEGMIRKSFRPTSEGLMVSVALGPEGSPQSVGLYRHPEDIPMPIAAAAVIGDLSWLVGAWKGARGEGGAISMEERWSPAAGGAMLAISRTVSRGRMSAFEFLRIVEREGSLVYIAQPGGGAATEFVLTEFTSNRAVFENPRHDYPKRISYELGPDGVLTATIGQLKGGTPRKFVFQREQG